MSIGANDASAAVNESAEKSTFRKTDKVLLVAQLKVRGKTDRAPPSWFLAEFKLRLMPCLPTRE